MSYASDYDPSEPSDWDRDVAKSPVDVIVISSSGENSIDYPMESEEVESARKPGMTFEDMMEDLRVQNEEESTWPVYGDIMEFPKEIMDYCNGVTSLRETQIALYMAEKAKRSARIIRKKADTGRVIIEAKIDNCRMPFTVIDTGSSYNIIDKTMYRTLTWKDYDPDNRKIVKYHGGQVRSLGQTMMLVNIGGYDIEATFQVIPDVDEVDAHMILGREFLKTGNGCIDYLNNKVHFKLSCETVSVDMGKDDRKD